MATPSIEKRLRKPKAKKFYCVELGRFHTAPGLRMENIGGRTLMSPPGERRFPPLSEPPRLLIDRSLGRAPADWELFHDFRLVSDRMKDVLEAVDREGVAFLKCESRSLGRNVAPDYWLCDVIRILDAIDEEKSRGEILEDGTESRRYSPIGGPSLVFKEEVVASAHIFRPRFWGKIVCDQAVKDACKAAGMKGIRFRDAAGE
jgi:hypothetical protein